MRVLSSVKRVDADGLLGEWRFVDTYGAVDRDAYCLILQYLTHRLFGTVRAT
jgi:hypothetical protein